MGNFANSSRNAGAVFLVFALLIGCGGGDASAPTAGELRVIGGANQSANIGATLPAPVVVQVQNGTVATPGVQLRPRVVGGGSVTPPEATTDASGQASFTWTLANSAGQQQLVIEDLTVTLRATVTATAIASSAVATVNVSPANAGLTSGQTQQFSATLRDALGAVLTGRVVAWNSTNTVVATVDPVSGVVRAVAPGSATITATSESKSGFSLVTVAAATNPVSTSLRMVTQPGNAVSGVAFGTQPAVEVLDQNGVRSTSSSTFVTVARDLGVGTLAGTVVVPSSNGLVTFNNLSITGTGTHSLAFSAPGLAGVSSQSFTVNGGSVANSLVITTQPGGAADNTVLTTQPVIEIRDASGALVTGSTALVTASVVSPPGSVVVVPATVAAVNGVARFTNLTVDAPTGAVVTLSFTSPGIATATSAPFTMAPVALRLTSLRDPANASNGVNFSVQPIVQVSVLSSGLVSFSSTAPVTASIATGTGTLSGTTTVNAVAGVATFTDLRITGSGPHTLSYSSSGITGTVSGTFTVNAVASPYSLNVGNTSTASVQAGQNITFPIVLDLSNAAGGSVGALTFSVTWDPTKFSFVSGTLNGAAGLFLTDNTTAAASIGTLGVSGFTTGGVNTTRTLYTIVLTAKVTAGNSNTLITAAVSAGGDGVGNNITITPRNLTVFITP